MASDSGVRPYATVNPYTGETVREFPFLDSGRIPDVVGRAATAFQSWRERPVADRAQMVRRAGDLMLERKDALAALLTQEVGKRIGESAWEVGLAASILQYYGDRGPEFLRPEPLPVDTGEAQIVDAPLGVLLGVEPWNFPLYQVVRFAGPNLVRRSEAIRVRPGAIPPWHVRVHQPQARPDLPPGHRLTRSRCDSPGAAALGPRTEEGHDDGR